MGEGWGDDGLAPCAVRCQWRCAQRSAGRHTAVTANGLAPPTAARGAMSDRLGWEAGFEAVRGEPMPNRYQGPLSYHLKARDFITYLNYLTCISYLYRNYFDYLMFISIISLLYHIIYLTII